MFKLGVQVSINKGLLFALEEALSLGCNAMQVFIRNPRGFKRRKFSRREVRLFKRFRKALRVCPFVIHAPYTLNLSALDRSLRKASKKVLKEDLDISDELEAEFYVIHFGSHPNRCEGLKLMQEEISEVLRSYKGNVLLLLENTAGGGYRLGASLEEIEYVFHKIKGKIGICLDTAHLYAYGYDIKERSKLDAFLNKFSKEIGLDNLKLLHLNDSFHPLGSRKDRHYHIGEGHIGEEGFALIINHPNLYNLPMILETPRAKLEDDIRNLNKVKYLRTTEGGRDEGI
jgi:deoxyribonuclease-4